MWQNRNIMKYCSVSEMLWPQILLSRCNKTYLTKCKKFYHYFNSFFCKVINCEAKVIIPHHIAIVISVTAVTQTKWEFLLHVFHFHWKTKDNCDIRSGSVQEVPWSSKNTIQLFFFCTCTVLILDLWRSTDRRFYALTTHFQEGTLNGITAGELRHVVFEVLLFLWTMSDTASRRGWRDSAFDFWN